MARGLLEGKAAIVTGGTSGIGRRIVELFREEGAAVLFTGRDGQRGREVEAETGGVYLGIDATRSDHAEEAVAAMLAAFGRLDVLVNNAGAAETRDTVETASIAAMEAAFRLHVVAPWRLIAEAARAMRAGGGGSVINMGSVAGQRVGASSVAYSVSKAALLHLTRCAAAEFGKDRIRVNSISAGFIATPIHTKGIAASPERKEALAGSIAQLFMARQSIRRVGETSDVAEAALFLASAASGFITGADIVLDGGLMWGQPLS